MGFAIRRRMRWALLGAAVTCLALISACARYKTTDQLRDELRGSRGDSSFMSFPCQALTVDEFGWTLDSLDGVVYRLHPSLKPYGFRTLRDVSYRSKNTRSWLSLSVPQGFTQIYSYTQNLAHSRLERCSIRDRVANVSVGLRGFDYETTVLWEDIGDGRQLMATIAGRNLEDLQLLRGTLFTMRFPGAVE